MDFLLKKVLNDDTIFGKFCTALVEDEQRAAATLLRKEECTLIEGSLEAEHSGATGTTDEQNGSK